MRTTATLREEHTVRRRVLRGLQVVVDALQHEGTLDERAAPVPLDFLERFVDGSHQAKEEDLMLRAIELEEGTDATEELRSLIELHIEQSSLLEATRAQLGRALDGDSWGLDPFVPCARRSLRLQHRHSRGEDHVLFPRLDELLEEQDEHRLLARFEAQFRHRNEPEPARVAADLCAQVGLLQPLTAGAPARSSASRRAPWLGPGPTSPPRATPAAARAASSAASAPA
jgi:hemerythrin-like domain-containing protein